MKFIITRLEKLRAWLENLRDRSYKRRRDIDLKVLWPCLKRHALDTLPDNPAGAFDLAREAFLLHMAQDLVWFSMVAEWTPQQFDDFVQSTLV